MTDPIKQLKHRIDCLYKKFLESSGSTVPQITQTTEIFTTSGIWTKPVGAKSVAVTIIAGGVGSGSGRKGAAGTTSSGGGGSAGSGLTFAGSVGASASTTGAFGSSGGGGGASTDNIGNSGAGGNGSPGVVIIKTYY